MPLSDSFAPAKVNLTLHVTGLRADGYHLLDSLVMFADVGDHITVSDAPDMSLTVTGPRAAGVPDDARNLCWRAAEWYGCAVAITLDKHLPAAAGIGGGSSDAAAVLRAMAEHYQRPFPTEGLAQLGADIPVCTVAHAAHMSGIGDHVLPLFMSPISAVLLNPGVEVSTPSVFKALTVKDNPPMTAGPDHGSTPAVIDWLKTQRNDLQAPAVALQPIIGEALAALVATEGARLSRMSGSGATCFALYDDSAAAEAAAQTLQGKYPDWWITATTLR